MFKKCFFSVFVILIPSLLLASTKGRVVFEKEDFYVIESNLGYSVMEWYGGRSLSEGDVIVGKLNSYGFKDVYNILTESETRVYIEDYYLDKDDAIQMVYSLAE